MIRRANGHLIYRGRQDRQVKLHGFRIELSEIENTLYDNREISGAHVRVENDELVAYIQSSANISADLLRQHLSQLLPTYMIPSRWAITEKFPLNANGKTDFKKLRAMLVARSSKDYVAPVGDTETRLAEIWQQILGIDTVGRTDDFVSLGGDSLSAIRLSLAVSEAFSTRISVTKLSQCHSLEAMAALIEQSETKSAPTIARKPEGANDIPLSPTLMVIWYACAGDERTMVKYNMPATTELPGNTTYEAFCDALNRCIAANDALRSSFRVGTDGTPMLHIEKTLTYQPGRVAVDADRLDELLADEAHSLIDIVNGPIFNCKYVEVGDGRKLCSLVIHHSLFDGLSIDLLFEALLKTLRGEALQQPIYTYADYVWNDTLFSKSEAYGQRKMFFERYLAGSTVINFEGSALSADMSGETFSTTVPSELLNRMDSYLRGNGFTQFELCYAMLHIALYKVFGARDFVTFFSSGGREQSEWLNVMGYFVHTMPARFRLEGVSTTILDVLKQTKRDLEALRSNEIDMIAIMSTEAARGLTPTIVFDMFSEPMGADGRETDAMCDLTFGFWRNGKSARLWSLHRKKVISTKKIQDIANTFILTLQQFLDNKDSLVDVDKWGRCSL